MLATMEALWNASANQGRRKRRHRGRIIMPHGKRAGVAAIAVLLAVLATPAAAESVEEFYKGKTISMVMGTGPGGSYDLYGRTIAPHLSRHIPGNPTIVM